MPGYFLDTSALGKRYHYEVGTPKVEAIFNDAKAERFISRLSVVEIQSVFAGKVRTQIISAPDFQLLHQLFVNDVASHALQVIRLTPAHFNEAERLIRKHALTKSLRTMDALQLAVTLELNQRGMIDFFVCADQKLCKVAQDEGLTIINPEIP
jgi:predicted nucleic acid-binding protein